MLRLAIPNRPGSLGAVATAMGAVGADINAVEIVERRDDSDVDDFMVDLPGETPPDVLVTACTDVAGVSVLWLSFYPESWGLHSDVDVLDAMTSDPGHAAAILTQAAPHVFHATWAVLINPATHMLMETSELAPDITAHALDSLAAFTQAGTYELPADWLPGLDDMLIAVAPLRDDTSIVLARHGGPEFMGSEVARLRHLAALAM